MVGKSTVPVGAARRLAARLSERASAGDAIELAWNPEFLREGTAVHDTMSPDRLVFGVTSSWSADRLRDVYAQRRRREVRARRRVLALLGLGGPDPGASLTLAGVEARGLAQGAGGSHDRAGQATTAATAASPGPTRGASWRSCT